MQIDTYINPYQPQTWSATGGTYQTLSSWNGEHEAQVVASNGYWANCPFNARSKWSDNQDAWCQENWCQAAHYLPTGKENKNSIHCGGGDRAGRCKRARQRRKPANNPQCNGGCKKPSVSNLPVAAAPIPAQESAPKAATTQESANVAPPLLPEHLSLLAPFLSSNVDSGSWRATCRDAKEALLPNGPYAAMLSPGGQAALVGLEKRKKLQEILVNARKLVSGLNFR